jgi:hypothetical protein
VTGRTNDLGPRAHAPIRAPAQPSPKRHDPRRARPGPLTDGEAKQPTPTDPLPNLALAWGLLSLALAGSGWR